MRETPTKYDLILDIAYSTIYSKFKAKGHFFVRKCISLHKRCCQQYFWS